MSRHGFSLLCLLLFGGVCVAQAGEPPILAESTTNPLRIWGCTLTQDWNKFLDPFGAPEHKGGMRPTYQGNPSTWWQQVEGTFTVYGVWFNDGTTPFTDPNNRPPGTDPVPVIPGSPGEGVPIKDLVDPAVLVQMVVTRIEFDTKELYYGCPTGQELEAPLIGSTPINANGDIFIKDIFGGTMEGVRIVLEKTTETFEGPRTDMLVLYWDHPGTYDEATTGGEVDAIPGDIVNIGVDVQLNSNPTFYYHIWVPQLTVNWASADFAGQGISPGYIDASDLAALSSVVWSPVVWGFAADIEPRNFFYNINPFAHSLHEIETTDLSIMAFHLGHSCQLGKPMAASEKSAILDWFGLAPTGNDLAPAPDGVRIPEIAIVDQAKWERAITDPYGYRTQILSKPVRESPWSTVKSLYR